MGDILLDYVFPISVLESIPAADTAFLKQVIVVALPKSGQEGNVGDIFPCDNMTQVAARTDNDESEQLFDAGMSRVYVLLADDLDIGAALAEYPGTAYTVLISSDFGDDALDGATAVPAVKASRKIQDITYEAVAAGVAGNSITVTYNDSKDDGTAEVSVVSNAISVAIESGVTPADAIAEAINAHVTASTMVEATVDEGDEDDPQSSAGVTTLALADGADATEIPSEIDVGTFDGMVAYATDDAAVAKAFGIPSNRDGWFTKSENGAKNMFFAYGKLLSNQLNWTNQQYIEMPADDGVTTLGQANALFDDRVSFVITSPQYGNRLGMFCAGGKAIIAPYVKKNLQIDSQGRSLSWFAANQPQYTKTYAALLESRLQADVIDAYVARGWLQSGRVTITLEGENFVGSGRFVIPDPTAYWRNVGEMRSE